MKISKEKIKNTIINFIVPLISLGVIIVLGVAIIYPVATSLPVLVEEHESKLRLRNQLQTKLAALDRLVDFKAVVEEDASLVSRVLVSDPSVPELLTQIDGIARDTGLEVTKLSYSFGESTTNEVTSYPTVVVSLGGLGNYTQIQTFLGVLENAARLVDVTTFRFAADTSDDSGLYNATFILSSPYLIVGSEAVTDEPIVLDVADSNFIALIELLKGFKFYSITVDEQFTALEEEGEVDEETSELEEIAEGEAGAEEESDLTQEELEGLTQ